MIAPHKLPEADRKLGGLYKWLNQLRAYSISNTLHGSHNNNVTRTRIGTVAGGKTGGETARSTQPVWQ